MRGFVVALAALLATACTGQAPPDPAKAQSYAVKIAVAPAPGGPLQRLPLPAAALAASRSPDQSDVRVFDGRGKVLPAARIAARSEEKGTRVRLAAYEIRQDRAGGQQRSVAVGSDGEIVARIDGGPGAAESRSALLDSRKVSGPVTEIALSANVPPQRIVNFELEASADLKTWEAIGEAALFRAEDATLGIGTIAVPGISLRNRYVRVSWTGPGVTLEAADLTYLPQNAPPRLAVPGTGARLVTAHDIRFRVPVVEAPAALVLKHTASDGIVPVRLFGRDSAEAPWQPLGAATLREDEPGGAMLGFGGTALREYRLEADARTAGFSAAPSMTLLFDAPELLVRFSGHPPYTLAAGLPGAPSAWLSPDEIAPEWQRQYEGLPRASAAAAIPTLQLAPPDDAGPLSPTRLALWLALLAGTGMLAFAVWRLMRGSAKEKGES